MLDITFDISDSELKRLEEAIIKEVGYKLQQNLNINKQRILIKLQAYLDEVFWNNKVVKNLQSDSSEGLRADVGVEANEMKTILTQILDALKRGIQVQDFRIQHVGNDYRLISKLTMIKENYSDILSVEGTSYPSNGFDITWLRWILYNAGEFVLLTQHRILRHLKDRDKHRSRSGLAIMVKSRNSVWRVPSWVFEAGHKNFIMVIAEKVETKLAQFVEEEL